MKKKCVVVVTVHRARCPVCGQSYTSSDYHTVLHLARQCRDQNVRFKFGRGDRFVNLFGDSDQTAKIVKKRIGGEHGHHFPEYQITIFKKGKKPGTRWVWEQTLVFAACKV